MKLLRRAQAAAPMPPAEVDIVVPCRFCGTPAVAVFELDAGCACFPDDRRQALCMQHVVRASPLGTMELAEDLTSGAFTAWWER